MTATVVCSVSSLCIGSSWTTAGTFGVAFMGISVGLGIPAPIAAGAIASGSVLGDKLSPLSDSTNLAAGVCESNLFDYVKAMVYTTIPAYIISLILYGIIGTRYSADTMQMDKVNEILGAINANFEVDAVPGIPGSFLRRYSTWALWAWTHGIMRRIHFNGHLDTVRACDGWSHDPKGEVVGNRFYGAGTDFWCRWRKLSRGRRICANRYRCSDNGDLIPFS